MSVVTRDLFSFAVSRQSGQEVDLVFEDSIQRLDGSFDVIQRVVPYMARVVDLSADEIQRLQEGGITIHSGASISIPYELEQTPDRILYNGATYKVVQAVPAENCSIFVVDKGAIGFSNVEAQA